MGIYDRYILPRLVDSSCRAKQIHFQRAKVVPAARGRVLEVGMGSGMNIPYYDPDKVDLVWGLEPSEGMRIRGADAVAKAPFDVRWLDLPGEEIPLDDDSVDTVVMTYTLCSIPDAPKALAQMKRVLKPGGELLFTEHGQAPDEAVRRWQNLINPVWKLIGGGCHVNRPIDRLIEESDFKMKQLESMYLPSTPRWVGFNYWGAAS